MSAAEETLGMWGGRMKQPGIGGGGEPLHGTSDIARRAGGGGGGGPIGGALRTVIGNLMKHPDVARQLITEGLHKKDPPKKKDDDDKDSVDMKPGEEQDMVAKEIDRIGGGGDWYGR